MNHALAINLDYMEKGYAEHLEDMMPQNRVELNLDEDGRPVEVFQDRYEEDEEGN